jgi:signal transduction histidine kinase/CheY-like chemotaxis protein
MDGRSIDVEVNANRVEYDGQPAILSFNRDLSERIRADDEKKRLEAQLQHAQRLESLGILAGGVAHDFNNLLLTIMGHAELAGIKADDPQRVREKLGEIELAATRAADLTQQLLAYAGKARFRIEQVDLTALATEMTKLLGTRLSTKARLEYEFAHELPAIAGDPTLLRQVIMNLLINASDSLDGTEGVIRVRTRVERFERSFLSETFVPADIAAGEYVVLEIADTGCGMDEKTMKRIFDPFFSTKFTGRGLGLAVTLRTVQRHRGALKVTSEPRAGTTFRLLLPPAADAARTAIVAPPRESSAAASPAGWALVVDDDASVRDVIRRLLETRNWTVTSASDGESALRVLEGAPTLDLIVLDLTMPGLSGAELVRAVRQRRPSTPLLIVSGYSSDEIDSRAPEIVVEAFLPKPFSSESLFQGIREARARVPVQLTL